MKYLLFVCATLVFVHPSFAVDADDRSETSTNTAAGGTGRYGLFDALDHRSAYTKDAFPEPFLVDDMALEDTELQFTWNHAKGRGRQSDLESIEFQKGLGLLTLEAQIPFEHIQTPHGTVEGLGPLELGGRYPLYQYVSANQMIDVTFGVGAQCGIPLQLRIEPNTELEPQVFSCLKLGQHFTAQTVLGYDVLFGSGDNGGERSYDLGVSFGYTIPHNQLPIPFVQQFIPMLELADEEGLNKDETGQHDFQGDLGFRAKFVPIGELQPDFGVAYVIPLDSAARKELHWGVIVSLIFDF